MWHEAALRRCKDLPPLAEFMGDKKQVKGVDETAIMARLKAYSKRHKEENS